MKKIYFPIQIRSKEKNITLAESMHLKRLDSSECMKNLSFERLEFSEDGLVSHFQPKAGGIWETYGISFRSIDPNKDLLSNLPNFALIVESLEQAKIALFAMKLHQGTKSGPSTGFVAIDGSRWEAHFLRFCPYWGGGLLEINRESKRALKSVTGLIRHDDKKLMTIIDKFLYAESYDCPSRAQRFFELAVILEMIFLPKNSQEITYRFSLRVAKWLHKYAGEDLESAFEKAKKIYKKRSDFAHSGACDIDDDFLNDVRAVTRKSISYYLQDESVFSDRNLDRLCLLG